MKKIIAFMAASAALAMAPAAQAQNTTPSTVDGKAENKGGVKTDPGTTGAMDNAVGGVATNPEDVKRQTEGKPTMADEGKSGRPAAGTKPGVTQHSPGTVGAAPGTTPPMSNERR
ncbi:MAG: hypothetical protein NW215_04400 [Hyphomicrobiales bacterium]|nr:hypothetical protein [Hyphomicrobiales bacterium]